MAQKLSAQRVSGRKVSMEALEGRQMLALVGGVDPYNMGKGEWIWQISSAMTNTGTTTVTGLANYLKDRGVKWVVVKAGDANDGPTKDYGMGGTPTAGSWTQFNSTLINTFHTAGIKIFGYHFIYGGGNPAPKVADTTPALERQVQKDIMSLNPDGLVIDAEGTYETAPDKNNTADAYGKQFKTYYPTKFLAHAPFPYVSLHKAFPYEQFNKWSDAIMPQAYWKTISIAQTPEKMLTDMDREYKALYAEFAAAGKWSSIKPIVPIAQGYDPSSTKPTPGAEVTRFFDLLRNDTDPASPFGYNGISFWSVQHHTSSIWQAVANGVINAGNGSISGVVFNDVDGDGIRDITETGIANRIIYDDTNDNTKRDGHEPYIKTNSQGEYTISYMTARQHRIRQELPTGWRQTSPSGGLSQAVTLKDKQQATAKNFGSSAMAVVNGTVFNDIDADGIKEVGEGALVGWTVFADADKDGVLDVDEVSAISDSKGNYVLTVPAGSYYVRQVIGSGYRVTTPASGFYDLTLSAGGTSVNFFGNTTRTLISGFVFNDKDGDGLKESGEAALKGWRVFADVDGDGIWDLEEASSVTDSTGKYRFNTLGAGTYRIAVVVQQDWAPTVPGSGSRKLTLASGGTTSNKNFGMTPIG